MDQLLHQQLTNEGDSLSMGFMCHNIFKMEQGQDTLPLGKGFQVTIKVFGSTYLLSIFVQWTVTLCNSLGPASSSVTTHKSSIITVWYWRLSSENCKSLINFPHYGMRSMVIGSLSTKVMSSKTSIDW